MNIRHLFGLLLIPCFLHSCAWNENDDNRIYLPGKTFQFQVDYYDADGKRLKIESLQLEVLDGFYPERKQTQIKWTLSQNTGDSPTLTEVTGVVDSKDYFFLHPPRCGDLHILSFAEFPQIPGSTVANPELGFTAEGKISMVKSFEGIQVNGVSTSRSYDGTQELIELPFGRVKTIPIIATAHSSIGEIRGKYFFHPELGFIRMDYTLPDSSLLSIYLLDDH